MATLTKPSGRRKSTAIDMTPMVDLAFLLLTFFVLTTNLTKPWALRMEMPEKINDSVTQPPIEAKRVLTIVLGKQDEIYWYVGIPNGLGEKSDFSNTGIRKVLIEKQSEINSMYVLIKPSDQSQYKNVVDILDEMIITNIKRYSVVEMEPEDKKLIASN